MFTNHIYLIYLHKNDLVLNNLQLLIYDKTQPNQIIYMCKGDLALNNQKLLIYSIKPNQTKSYIYMCVYKEDLVLNNQQWLICHKTQPNQIIYI